VQASAIQKFQSQMSRGGDQDEGHKNMGAFEGELNS
jgi:hypothetical protein